MTGSGFMLRRIRALPRRSENFSRREFTRNREIRSGMVDGAALSHTRDLSEIATRHPGDPLPRAAVDLGGIRTLLVVPLRKDGALLGVIAAYRQEVRPFSDK